MKNHMHEWVLGLVVLVALASPAAAAPMVMQRGGNIDPPSLDPNLGTSSPASPMLSDMVEGLVVRGADGYPAPGCAESWTVSEDGLTYTFRLRAGLKWSDGRPLAGEDFVYSFRRLVDPATASPAAGLFYVIDGAAGIARGTAPPSALGVSAPDPRTVVIRLTAPAPYFIQLLANSQGVPVPRHAIEQHGRDWTRPGNLVSNGAYVLAERVPQTYIKLVRNPHFHAADTVQVDEVYWRPIQDLGAAFRQFRAGEVHTLLMAPPDELGWIRANMPDALHMNPAQATWFLAFNMGRAPVDDLRVRRALSLAIDQRAIADQLLQGMVRPATSLVAPGTGGYPPLPVADAGLSMDTRQAEARALLEAAGYGPERPLEVVAVYDTQEENRKIMVAIAAMWRAIGVVVELQNIEGRALMGRLRSGDYSIARSITFAVYDDPYAFLQKFRADSTDNRSGYLNPDYDALLDRANAESDPDARLALMADAEAMLMADAPLVPVYWFVGKVLVSPRVRGWQDAPLGTPMTRYLSLD